ncbi:hypothetical protein COY93_04480 [Candidatus Uhrbacteria bacterium CG_4_10_14_0_8_um_filter_58_22]|uniref:Cation/H+ exchanger transmembrane domain-containing protein n=1 Tax=Candidatus Uhrbacteria bacterium CG_4_10_14_0_8_um_filter_58_22 TaxID=1975029 RepID=A0A2M7Q9S0_9BACT|nr:MAG: hypothetical protein AUJ19_02340 [Parcubacteria group bacterium CG1_02_58_44]PIY61971.1 MAG: hypothetical protein COY93_04480 [Candidatus Uhrbacteria bacterium CG_4_10_14_0_8_um_filter_58_22]
MNLFLFVAGTLLLTLLFGKALERFRVPWIFAALLIGAGIAVFGHPFDGIISSETFRSFAEIGMYLLLFLVGLELDLDKLRQRGKFIVTSALIIIPAEAVFGTLLIHFIFGTSWLIAAVVALSFATVGEAILIPILQEFGIVNTTLGQSILGIGTVDDVIELLMLLAVIFLIGRHDPWAFGTVFVFLAFLVVLTAGLRWLKSTVKKFRFGGTETLLVFVLAIFFLFVGIGSYASAGPIAAILAGIILRLFVPAERMALLESEIKGLTYGLFVPIFFLSVGAELDFGYLIVHPFVVLLIVAVSNCVKILASYAVGRKQLGTKGSILLGIGLSVRFSTSIVIMTLLFSNGLIGPELFSAVIASSIVFKFVIPVLFSRLLVRWGFAQAKPGVGSKASGISSELAG